MAPTQAHIHRWPKHCTNQRHHPRVQMRTPPWTPCLTILQWTTNLSAYPHQPPLPRSLPLIRPCPPRPSTYHRPSLLRTILQPRTALRPPHPCTPPCPILRRPLWHHPRPIRALLDPPKGTATPASSTKTPLPLHTISQQQPTRILSTNSATTGSIPAIKLLLSVTFTNRTVLLVSHSHQCSFEHSSTANKRIVLCKTPSAATRH